MADATAVVRPSFRREDARGTFVEVLNGPSWPCVIHGRMRPGAVLGNHYHARTEVFFYLTGGRADIVSLTRATGDRTSCTIGADEGVRLGPGVAHAIHFLEESTFLLLKSERYDPA